MKKIYALALLLFCFCSCVHKQLIEISSGHDASVSEKGNFILFKSGREMKLPDSLDLKTGILNMDKTRKIKVNGTKYAAKDIASIQINGEYFVNIGKKQFIKRIYHGPLNVYDSYVTSTSTSFNNTAGGGSYTSTSTSVSTKYYVGKDSMKGGGIISISGFGNQKKLMPYITDYKPSRDILTKYQQQRRVSRIVKFSVAGLWAASIPVFMGSKEGSTLELVSGTTFLTGLVAVPVFTFTFKNGNHKRPYKAVQAYIDNNFYKDATVNLSTNDDSLKTAGNNTDTNSFAGNFQETKKDFIIINNNQQIVADSGSKLLIANNHIFSINNQKYSDNVTAFQFKKKFYKRLSEKESDFGLRIISGKINVYNKRKEVGFSGTGGTYHSISLKYNPLGGVSSTDFFEKEGFGPMRSNTLKLSDYFMDDPTYLAKYKAYKLHYRTVQGINIGLGVVTIGSLVMFVAKNKDMDYNKYKDPLIYICTGSAIANIAFTFSSIKKLESQFANIIMGYNRRK